MCAWEENKIKNKLNIIFLLKYKMYLVEYLFVLKIIVSSRQVTYMIVLVPKSSRRAGLRCRERPSLDYLTTWALCLWTTWKRTPAPFLQPSTISHDQYLKSFQSKSIRYIYKIPILLSLSKKEIFRLISTHLVLYMYILIRDVPWEPMLLFPTISSCKSTKVN